MIVRYYSLTKEHYSFTDKCEFDSVKDEHEWVVCMSKVYEVKQISQEEYYSKK